MHSFINHKLSQNLNIFIYLVLKFEEMTIDGGPIDCLVKCHSITFTMGDYFIDIPMIWNLKGWF